MSNAKQTKSPNSDLVMAARTHRDQILKFYDQLDDNQPVILFDYNRLKLRSYPFEDYKAKLREESQAMLDDEYERAVMKNKILVVVWDSETRRLVTTKIRRD